MRRHAAKIFKYEIGDRIRNSQTLLHGEVTIRLDMVGGRFYEVRWSEGFCEQLSEVALSDGEIYTFYKRDGRS